MRQQVARRPDGHRPRGDGARGPAGGQGHRRRTRSRDESGRAGSAGRSGIRRCPAAGTAPVPRPWLAAASAAIVGPVDVDGDVGESGRVRTRAQNRAMTMESAPRSSKKLLVTGTRRCREPRPAPPRTRLRAPLGNAAGKSGAGGAIRDGAGAGSAVGAVRGAGRRVVGAGVGAAAGFGGAGTARGAEAVGGAERTCSSRPASSVRSRLSSARAARSSSSTPGPSMGRNSPVSLSARWRSLGRGSSDSRAARDAEVMIRPPASR